MVPQHSGTGTGSLWPVDEPMKDELFAWKCHLVRLCRDRDCRVQEGREDGPANPCGSMREVVTWSRPLFQGRHGPDEVLHPPPARPAQVARGKTGGGGRPVRRLVMGIPSFCGWYP